MPKDETLMGDKLPVGYMARPSQNTEPRHYCVPCIEYGLVRVYCLTQIIWDRDLVEHEHYICAGCEQPLLSMTREEIK